jgi:hypothetical protein
MELAKKAEEAFQRLKDLDDIEAKIQRLREDIAWAQVRDIRKARGTC